MRDHEAAQGHFHLDPCNLHPGEADVVADRIADTLRRLRDEPVEPPGDLERRRFESLARWPDREEARLDGAAFPGLGGA